MLAENPIPPEFDFHWNAEYNRLIVFDSFVGVQPRVQHLPLALSTDRPLVSFLEQGFLRLTQPASHSIVLSSATDLTRSRADLITEIALLRQYLSVLHRQVKKPSVSQSDRLWIVLLASRVKHWKEARLIFKPDTLLRWHRRGFRLFWKFKSRNRRERPKLSTDTIALIYQMAKENRLGSAERIREELLKLDVTVAKHTIQTYIARVRLDKPASHSRATFLKNHAQDIWACDFLPIIDIWFRPLFLFFIVELASRRISTSGSRVHQRILGWLSNCARQPRSDRHRVS